MLYIQKKSPPQEMIRRVSQIKSSTDWKNISESDTQAIRRQFDLMPKDIIRQSLLEEQHYLCAYCMKKITNDGQKTTLEHWYPLSKDKDKALDYNNLLAVCDGGRNWGGNGQRYLCCDARKADQEKLTVSPLNKQQMNLLIYDKDGFIKTFPRNDLLEKDINDILCLNGIHTASGKYIADTSTGLVKGRKDAYLSYKRFIERLDKNSKCTSGNVLKKIRQIENADCMPEYAGVLLYFLNKKYKELLKRGK